MSLRSLALQLGGHFSTQRWPTTVAQTIGACTRRHVENFRMLYTSGTSWYGKSPADAGGPPKGFSSMKRRFKVTGSGAIRCMSPGFVHKRFNKSKKRLNRLSKGILVPPTYEKMMKKLGFVSRRF